MALVLPGEQRFYYDDDGGVGGPVLDMTSQDDLLGQIPKPLVNMNQSHMKIYKHMATVRHKQAAS